MNEDTEQLKKDVADLKAWRQKKDLQQISYPLDTQSVNILNKYFVRIYNVLGLIYGGVSLRSFMTLFLKQDTLEFSIAEDTFQTYTVNPATDVFTVQNGGYQDDDELYVFTSDTQPTPLALNATVYYVVSASGLTFKLSATSGGAPINITDAGTGVQFIDYVPR